MTSPLVEAVLTFLSTSPGDAAASRPGVADLVAAIRESHHEGDGALARALVDQLAYRLRR